MYNCFENEVLLKKLKYLNQQLIIELRYLQKDKFYLTEVIQQHDCCLFARGCGKTLNADKNVAKLLLLYLSLTNLSILV